MLVCCTCVCVVCIRKRKLFKGKSSLKHTALYYKYIDIKILVVSGAKKWGFSVNNLAVTRVVQY